MKRTAKRSLRLGMLWTVLALTVPAQVATTGQLVGAVQDQSGAVVPGVELQLQNEDTRAVLTAAASADGGFVFPTLSPGSYTLTISKQGFDTTVYKGIIIYAARTTNQTIVMKVGAVTQTVEVLGGAQVLQTTANTIANTVDQKYLQDLPLPGRSALPFVLLSSGAQQGVTSRDSTINGLPGGSLNITLNGINNNAQRFKSGGTSFFAFVTPRLESVQEVTIATSNLGANSTGQGAIQIQFVTKSGTNAWHGEVFWQHQNSALSANNWFNNARNIKRPVFIQNDQGGTLGGPIVKNKLFFFVSYAHVKTPQSADFEARVLTPAAQTGLFTYTETTKERALRTVNLLQIAGQNVNPIIGAQLQKIQSSTSAGALSTFDSIRNRLRWVAPSPVTNQFMTARFDYQLTEKLRVSVSDTYNRNVNARGFRGTVLPGVFTQEQSVGQISNPYIANASATWTISPNIVNEFNFGIQSNQETFNIGYDRSLFQPRLLNFPLNLPSGLEATNGLGFGTTFQPRNNPIYNFADNFFYQRGNHSFSFGGNYMRSVVHQGTLGDAGTPRFSFGVVSNDPVNAIFNPTTLPNISDEARNDALALYALLTGTVSNVAKSVNVDEKTRQYADDQSVIIRERQTSFGLYAQDSWRASRSLTVNYGLRWDFQGDVFNTNDIYTSPTLQDLFGPSGGSGNSPNLFNPGSLGGIANPAINQRSHAYKRDWVNPAPHLGLAWNPSFQQGWLGRAFGDRKTVFRGGYSISYYAEGLLNFTNNAGNNPGLRQTGNLVPGVDFAPGTLQLGEPLPPFKLFPASFSFPLALSNFTFSNTNISTIDPNIRAPYVQTWSAGIQRELRQGTVLEVRYAGNRGARLWRTFNINETNIFENGFLTQFKDAQRNLALFMAANPKCGQTGEPLCSFANSGLAGQVAIPIFQTAFTGFTSLPAGQAFSNATFITQLQTGQAGALANTFATTPAYFCRLVGNSFAPCASSVFNTPGQYPINLFRLNPFIGNANVLSDNSFSNYNAMQIEFRQRLTRGLTMNVNYSWAHAMNDRYNKNVDNIGNFATLRNRRLDYGPSTFDIRHVLQAFGTYDLPVGRGRKFSVNNAVLDGVVGGWTVGAIFRMQSGLPFKLSSGRLTVNQSDAGVVLSGTTTASDLQKLVGVFKGSGPDVFFLDPKLAGSDGRANSAFLAPPSTPGEFGSFVYLYGPRFVTTDLSLAKAAPIIKEKLRMEFRAELVNAFNHPIFEVPTGGTFGVTPVSITATNFGRTTTATTLPRQVQFRLQFRF
jgi:Carboxypeptidase regulatory-like domain